MMPHGQAVVGKGPLGRERGLRAQKFRILDGPLQPSGCTEVMPGEVEERVEPSDAQGLDRAEGRWWRAGSGGITGGADDVSSLPWLSCRPGPA